MRYTLWERETIEKARAILDSKTRWTTHTTARDLNDKAVESNDETAVKFCAWGALERAAGGYSVLRAAELVELDTLMALGLTATSLVSINDRWEEDGYDGHEAVKAVFDATLFLLDQEATLQEKA